MEGPIPFWGYKEQESNLILSEHDDDDDENYSTLKADNFARGNKKCGLPTTDVLK